MAAPSCPKCGCPVDVVSVATVASPCGVTFVVCAGCDRICCPGCHTIDRSGRADRCRWCGRYLWVKGTW